MLAADYALRVGGLASSYMAPMTIRRFWGAVLDLLEGADKGLQIGGRAFHQDTANQ